MSTALSREEALFADALSRPADERSAFLAQVCGADDALRASLVALVAAHEGPDSLLAGAPARRPAVQGEKAGDRIGRYTLLQKIGEGGCGVVWMAEQQEPVRRRIALKVIKLGMDTKSVVARFEAERQALAMMDHPNIAKVHDAGSTEAGRPFFVMELVRGITITKYCDENHLNPTERLELFIKVCHAVQHAHQKGIIHRDLKPSNILVTLNDGIPTPKIIDFGIAKATLGRLTDATLFTAFEQFVGTPVYMSPEQAEMSSLDIDTRADIYSLGALLYELLTGRPPFDPKAFAQAGIDEVRHHIRDDMLLRPSARLRTLGDEERTAIARLRNTAPGQLSVFLRGDLDWIVMRCMEKDRTRRYDTADGIAADIQRHLRHEPVVARPPSTGYLLQKLVRRHRVGLAAAVVVVGSLVGGLGIAVSSLRQERTARDRAVAAERDQIRLRETAEQAQANEAALRRTAETQQIAVRRRAYASDMNLVQQALAVDDFGRARQLLDRHRPEPGKEDLRGWEWRYLWQETARSDVGEVIGVTPGIIWSMASSSDGNWLASGHYWYAGELGGFVKVWDLRGRQQFDLRIGDGHTLVEFSPREPLVAISGYNRDEPEKSWIELWNVTTRQMEQRLEIGAASAALAFSDDGEILVTSTCNDVRYSPKRWPTITHWQIRDGRKLSSYRAPETSFSFDSQYPFVVSSDLQLAAYPTQNGKEFRVIELNSGRERWCGRTSGIPTALAFSPDGKLLASGDYGSKAIHLWDVGSGDEVGQLEGHRGGGVLSLVFWPDGKMLASASGDRTIRLWDVPSRRQLRTLSGHRSFVNETEVLRSGLLISSDRDGTVRMWNPVAAPEPEVARMVVERVTGWRFGTDSRSVLMSHPDLRISELAIPGFQVKREIKIDVPEAMRDSLARRRVFDETALFASDRPLIAIGSRDGIVWVFDFERSAHLAEIKISSGPVLPVGFSGHGNRLIIYDGTGSPPAYHEWDVARGVETATWPALERHKWEHFTRTPDEKFAIMLGPDGNGLVRDMTTGGSQSIRLSTEAVSAVGVSIDGRVLAIASRAGYAKLWKFPNCDEIATMSGLYGMHSVAFSPDDARLATGCGVPPDAVRLWDTESHQLVLSLGAGRGTFVETAFSRDGTTLGSVSHVGQLQLWRAPSWEEIEAAEKTPAAAARGP